MPIVISPMALLLLTSLVTVLSATEAHALNVQGTLTFWDTRSFRSNNTGSQLTASSANANRPLPNAFVLLMDQDGNCPDKDPGCGELDDDYLAWDYTDANGVYSWTGIADGSDVYVMFDYYIWGHYVLDGVAPIWRTDLTA